MQSGQHTSGANHKIEREREDDRVAVLATIRESSARCNTWGNSCPVEKGALKQAGL